MQNTIHKTEKNSMKSERRKAEKIDNLRVPQTNQEMCAPSTNTRSTTLSHGQNSQKMDNMRVPQPNQEMCALCTNTRTTTLFRDQNSQIVGQIVKNRMNEK